MLAFDVHNNIVHSDPGRPPGTVKKREKRKKANKRARAQRRKK